jgi:hypothetical protein
MEVATITIGLTSMVIYICIGCRNHLVVEHRDGGLECFIQALNNTVIVQTDGDRCLGQFVRCAKCASSDAVSSDAKDEYLESIDKLVLQDPLNTMRDIWDIVFLRTSEGYRVVSFSFCLPFIADGCISRFDLVSKTFILVDNADPFIGLEQPEFDDGEVVEIILTENVSGDDDVNCSTSEAK